MKITVLGAGNWGTTIALLLHSNGHEVRLWEYNAALAEQMMAQRENTIYLPGFPLPDDIYITSNMDDALKGSMLVVFVVPSSVMRDTAKSVSRSNSLESHASLVSLTKGLEHDSLMTMTDIISEEIHGHVTVALSGPCIASEVAAQLPTTIVAASVHAQAAEKVQDVFMTPRFRVYTSNDPRGVQFGGALKNIIAVAAGINDGLGFGTNSKSALVTRGIVEMKRFAEIEGTNPETFNGLSGVGDLITTCFSPHSRNRRLGEKIAQGGDIEDIRRDMVMVVEGVPTAAAVYDYAREHDIDMPITEVVYRVLFERLSPQKSVSDLMMRDRKPEL